MKHTARYIDSGFYRISDRAAAALCRLAGKPLPRAGYEMSVLLATSPSVPAFASAWVIRTPYSVRLDAPERGWVWAVHSLKLPEDVLSTPKLGREFTFEA